MKECADPNEAFHTANEVMVNMNDHSIINSASKGKVIRTALTDAAGEASLLCTAEVRIL